MVAQWNLYNQDTIGGQYKFRSFREVVLFLEVQELWKPIIWDLETL